MFEPTCPNCGGEDIEFHPLFSDTEPGDELYLELGTCQDCYLTAEASQFDDED
jgi:hypothetical protein